MSFYCFFITAFSLLQFFQLHYVVQLCKQNFRGDFVEYRFIKMISQCVAHKPITTIRQLLTNVKDRVEPKDRQGAVYKIKCYDCPANYVGATGRNLKTRLTEHRRATKNGDNKNNIAEHHLQTDHRIDWD